MRVASKFAARAVLLASITLCPVGQAFAQEVAQPAPAPEQGDPHSRPGSEIVVTGVLQRERLDALSGVAVLSGEELAAKVRPSLGETLARTPGVSATSFGPTASRPIGTSALAAAERSLAALP